MLIVGGTPFLAMHMYAPMSSGVTRGMLRTGCEYLRSETHHHLSPLPALIIFSDVRLTFFNAARFLVLRPNRQVLLSPPADGGRGVAVRPALQVCRLSLLQLEVCRRLRNVGRNHNVEVRRLSGRERSASFV